MTHAVLTFGCRVNQADSFGFEEDLLAGGSVAAAVQDADLVVVNTCSVTASADQAARQAIRRVSRLNPNARIVVTGCYATRRPDDVCDLPNVVKVVANDDKPQLIPLLRHAGMAPELTSAQRFGDGDGSCGATLEPGVAGRTAFTMRVQTGCAEPCSYCIIPSTRGVPRSRPPSEVVEEVRRVTAAGFREIAVTGVHLGSYGRDLSPVSSLPALLEALDRTATEGPRRLFRVSSLEPMDCTAAVVDLMARSPAFAPHFHLPLQHASNRMLALMARPYTLEYYAALVGDIRRRIPGASIGSDLIVGFPGETEHDFETLASYLAESPLTHLHVFPYSDRPGTVASRLPDKVNGLAVRERSRRLREISERLSKRFRASQAGTIHEALTIDDGLSAVTGNYLKLRIGPGHARNEWVRLRVVSDGTGLSGTPTVS